MQLDTDEDGEPFFKPSAASGNSVQQQQQQQRDQEHNDQHPAESPHSKDDALQDGRSKQAAVATIESGE